MEQYSEFFTQRKPTKHGSKILRWWHQRMFAIASKHIPQFKNKSLYEIGVGHGFIADICRQKHVKFSGHEMNAAQAKFLKSAGYDVEATQIPPIPAGNPVQVIWLSHVLEHTADFREAKQMLQACYDRLDPDGYIVIIAPDIHHWKMDFWTVDWSHGFPTSLKRVEQLLNDSGFSVHKSMHHSLTITQPFIAWLSSTLFRLFLPISLIDAALLKVFKRKYAYSFMSVYGWRQIYLIGRKLAVES